MCVCTCVCVCVCVCVCGKQVESNRERDRDQKRLLETCMCGIMIISLCVPLVCMRGFVLLGSVCVYIGVCVKDQRAAQLRQPSPTSQEVHKKGKKGLCLLSSCQRYCPFPPLGVCEC